MTLYKFVLFRVYADRAFQPLGETFVVQPGAPGSGNFFKEFAVSIINSGSNNVAYIPQFVLPATTDALITNQARYVFGFYRTDGSLLAFYMCGSVSQLALPTPSPTTLTAICQFNAPPAIVPPNNEAYTKSVIDNRFPSCTAGQSYIFAVSGNVLSCSSVAGGGLPDPGSNGIVVRTAPLTTVARSIGVNTGLSIANGDGVSGNPVISLDGDLVALAQNSTNGFWAHTSADAGSARTFVQPAAGITITNGDGVNGNPTFALANDLAAVEGISTTGFAVRTQTDTWLTRTITGTANKITVTNGDGVSANPTLTIADAFDISMHTSTAPIKVGTSLPGTCTVGQYFFDSDAAAGQNTYACTSTNTFTLQGDGGGGGGGTPAGTGSEIQARLNASTFQAVTGSSTSNGGITLVGQAVSGGSAFVVMTGGAHTNVTADVNDLVQNAHTITVTGGYALQRFSRFIASTITAGSVQTVTTACTLCVDGAPIAAGSAVITNPLSFFVDSGRSGFEGRADFGVITTSTSHQVRIESQNSTDITLRLVAHASQSTDILKVVTPGLSEFAVRSKGEVESFADARSGTANPYFKIGAPPDVTLTGDTEAIGIQLIGSGITRQFSQAGGAFALQREIVINPVTYAFTSADTITSAINVDFNGSPIQGTNATLTNSYVARMTPSAAAHHGLWIEHVSSATGDLLRLGINGTNIVRYAAASGPKINSVFSNAALATNSADGFIYYPSTAGTPTGTPTSFTGTVPTVVDTTNSRFYGFISGAWVNLTGAGGGGSPGGSDGQLQYRVNSTTFGGVAGSNSDTNGVVSLAPTAVATGSPVTFSVTGAAHTNLTTATENTDLNFNLSATKQFATGAITLNRDVRIQARTLAFVGASTVTRAVTLDVTSPIAGTNATLTNSNALRLKASANGHTPLYIESGASPTADIVQLTADAGTTNHLRVLNAGQLYLKNDGAGVGDFAPHAQAIALYFEPLLGDAHARAAFRLVRLLRQ